MNKNDKEFLVQKIRAEYTEKEHTELDSLKELDSKVKLPAKVFSYVFGSISAVVLGFGMSLIMTDLGEVVGIEETMSVGIIIGLIGLAGTIATYPIYKAIWNFRRQQFAAEIFALSDKIMNK